MSTSKKQSPFRKGLPQSELVWADHVRSLRWLLLNLPLLQCNLRGELDLQGTPSAQLSELVAHAECSVKAINLGLAAVGNLIPYAAPEIEDGTVSSDTVEALGWLIAELSDFAAGCTVLAAKCRQALGR